MGNRPLFTPSEPTEREWLEGLRPEDEAEYEWCWIACPHTPPCPDAPRSSDPRDE